MEDGVMCKKLCSLCGKEITSIFRFVPLWLAWLNKSTVEENNSVGCMTILVFSEMKAGSHALFCRE